MQTEDEPSNATAAASTEPFSSVPLSLAPLPAPLSSNIVITLIHSRIRPIISYIPALVLAIIPI
jgi:hypothetical protein